ncbi:high affinity sulfate transporter 1 [Oryzihumus leptocrescens]|uniref:High affinity sulfate transporter 1 n=1 Tax=Oryzihumus leptocrescens TaxID=297536 RepID=A0A542ZI66_9MICO|nr:sulfate permease [Oryzihumus leptocrescens]TQL60041.1 high affinity sulfate transporter 1 [Oryzihumus leptocrescens]
MASRGGVASVLPGIVDLRGYQRVWLRGDVLAGVTVAAYLIPQVMAYAGVAGLPPVAGLWAIVPAMAAYVLFGSSRQLSVGPESTTALMAATVVAPLAGGNPARYAVLAAGLAMVVGAFCVLAWLARLGFVADLLSKPVLVGYMAGVAMIMIVGQLEKVTGIPVEGDTMVQQLRSFLGGLDQVKWPTVLLSVAVLALLFVLQRFPRLPGPLIAVLLAALAVPVFDLSAYGITVVGEIPGGLPRPQLPDLQAGDLQALLLAAVGVAVVGYTDNVLTARAFADRGGYEVDANQELLALGAANVGAGLMQGFPVSSSGSRTALGDTAGSRTQLYTLVALAGVLLVLLVGGGVLASFPNAALGALIIYAATRLVDLPEFRRIARFRRSELVLALVTFVGVLVFDILYGVLIAVAVSAADLLRRVARPHDAVLGQVEGLAGMHDVDDYPTATTIPGLVVYRYDSPLFFANAEDFKTRALEAADAAVDLRWFVLNVEANVEVDITALDAVEQLRAEMERRGVVFAMARVKQDLREELRAFGLAQSVGEEHLYPTLPTAVAAYQGWASEHRTPAAADPEPPAPAA